MHPTHDEDRANLHRASFDAVPCLAQQDRHESARQLEDAECLVDELGLPRFGRAIRRYKIHADAPTEGKVVNQYPEFAQTAKSIDDYRAAALELMLIWANAATASS